MELRAKTSDVELFEMTMANLEEIRTMTGRSRGEVIMYCVNEMYENFYKRMKGVL